MKLKENFFLFDSFFKPTINIAQHILCKLVIYKKRARAFEK